MSTMQVSRPPPYLPSVKNKKGPGAHHRQKKASGSWADLFVNTFSGSKRRVADMAKWERRALESLTPGAVYQVWSDRQ
eukprot:NODE_2132_length_761_cov_3.015449_g1717_i0.p3 GENE.NODE_2132_length_761_cov_3.015449_g1717_i0~~NODE_2132_length_761_cov_3.015449_g1717_i0.p3  ORF type:complete len:78 (-),score=1.61 NODE_2132_length_761_cov_3.015449_g1717_i0:281-514(-)